MSHSDEDIEEFKAEALELLEVAEKNLLALDQGAEFRKAYDAIFRSFHNLKGSAGMMELDKLQAYMHELENCLVGFKNETILPKNEISYFLQGIDNARHILDGREPEAKKPANDMPDTAVAEFIQECEEIVERVAKTLELFESGRQTKDHIDALYRDVHSLKGTAYLFSYARLGDVGHAMESSLEKVRDGTHLPTPDLVNCLYGSLKIIESLLTLAKKKQSDVELDAQVAELGKCLSEASNSLPEVNVPAAVVASSEVIEGAGSIRVPVVLLDSLMALMGEMVLVRNQVLQYSSRSEDLEFVSMSKRLNVVTSEIQGELMKTRMQPIGQVIGKFTRLVRDLSHELNKTINLNLSGVETELDKSLLEAIKDPLTHIVRNSCDHGIETPEVRRKTGKPEAGTISIRAFHEGGQVIIEVSDDGKGLNKEVLLKKASEKGLVTAAQSAKLSEKEIFNLIFAPGFSTAEKVTNVSGRGVGMDVVRTNIERIGGTVDLSSRQGAGTVTKIKIPLTLAIVPALIVKCGTGTYAIPQVQLEELVRVDLSANEHTIEYLHGAPVYRLRGNILPLLDLNILLGLNSKTDERKNKIVTIAVLNSENCSFGVLVDEVQDTADIVVKPLNRLLKSLQVYSGATVLGDGSIALIFDVLGISKVAQIARDRMKISDAETDNKIRQEGELQDFLLVSVNSKTKHALVLSYVHRLEVFKSSDVEYTGTQKVVRYGKTILPIISANGVLGYGADDSKSETLSVVVIERAGRLFGIEVNSILDTLSTTVEMDVNLVSQVGIFGNLNMKSELIVVIDPFQMIANALGEEAETVTPWRSAATESHDNLHQILLVEDNVFFRRTIKGILESEGYDVQTAANGEEAIVILDQSGSSIQMIVSDIEMPRVNGLQLAAKVRQNPNWAHIPMMAVSSLADKKAVQRGTQAGFDVYLEKLKPDALLSKVSELCRKNRGVA